MSGTMPVNPDKLTSEIGLAICAAINKHWKQHAEKLAHAAELHWNADIVLSNGDVLSLSER